MTLPFVVSLPHCSSLIPNAIRPLLALTAEEIHDAEDLGSAGVFGGLPVMVTLKAAWSRLVADLNRSADDLGGKGVVARSDYRGRPVFRHGMYPDQAMIRNWIADFYQPYHNTLSAALADPFVKGLFDCHSLNGTGPADAPDAGRKRKDIIISNNGNGNGQVDPRLGDISCPADIVQEVAAAFAQAGFSTAVNDPYQGGFITVHYGRKMMKNGRFALQIEMNQDLCLQKGSGHLDPEKVREAGGRMTSVFQEIANRIL